jgi:predicted nuclease of predicted toxin-antitoxin system
MALRFPADHCISNSIIRSLQDQNHEVIRLRDVLPVDSVDATVIAKAQELGLILLSMNGDFADIVTHPPRQYAGIVALQIRNHPEILDVLLARLNQFLTSNADPGNYRGKLIVVDANRIRIRE